MGLFYAELGQLAMWTPEAMRRTTVIFVAWAVCYHIGCVVLVYISL